MELFADGISLGKDNEQWNTATNFVIPGNTTIIAVAAKNSHRPPGILGSLSNGLVTNSSWKCNNRRDPGWNYRDFDDRNWTAAVEFARNGDGPEGYIAGIDPTAKWIRASRHRFGGQRFGTCYCRINLQ